MNTQKYINAVCEHRSLPSVKKGMICRVDGELGFVTGGNHAGNFNVNFIRAGKSVVRNCHPFYKFEILNGDGSLFYKSDDII